jgi:hypothetical protein
VSSLNIFAVFHLNLAYSSIEEDQRPQVIEHCYWPLLQLTRKQRLPLGIETTGYTLEVIASLDPAWTAELRRLSTEGLCEFIGSGYTQIIGPLVPAEVNAANMRLGHQTYERLLGFRPRIALVNEQAYSAGMLQHYLDADYQAIIMEWNNPARYHPEWDPEWRYLPQIACGTDNKEIALIWNKSIAFQKFQRYAQGEIELDEYLAYLESHLADTPRAFPLYGNDVEVFDFRPERYHTEPTLNGGSEWIRIEDLFRSLLSEGRFQFIRPSEVLMMLDEPNAGNGLHLESPEQPIPVKKQGKYNITRWAVTGRNDTGINSACWRLFEMLRADQAAGNEDWRELCYLWGSDFRTHITERRWEAYRSRLHTFEHKLQERGKERKQFVPASLRTATRHDFASKPRVERRRRYLEIETDLLRVRLNCHRGLAVEKLWFKSVSEQALLGTLPHGFYEDIDWGADYYTGHLVFEAPGQAKVTDLNPVDPLVETDEKQGQVVIRGCVSTSSGPITKTISLNADGTLNLEYGLSWSEVPLGSLRLGHITLNPKAFDYGRLYFETHNGGADSERFEIGGRHIDHGRSVSFLVSANGGVGMTENQIACGDTLKRVVVSTRHAQGCTIALISSMPIRESYFFRIAFSAQEIDETSRGVSREFPKHFGLTLSACRTIL